MLGLVHIAGVYGWINNTLLASASRLFGISASALSAAISRNAWLSGHLG